MRFSSGVVAALVGLLGLWALANPAHAQTAEDGTIELDVRLGRPWFGPATPLVLDVDVAVADGPGGEPSDLRVSVALYERARSRSALDRILGGRLPRTPLEAFTFRLADVPGGARRTLHVEQDPAALPAFEGAPDGLYPLSVSVRRSTGPSLADATTAVVWMSEPAVTPLRLLPVVEVAHRPLRSADGALPEGSERVLDGLLRAAEGLASADVPMGVALDPTFLGELAGLEEAAAAEGAGPLLRAIRNLSKVAEPLTVPSYRAQLPHLRDLPDRGLAEVLEEGRGTVEAITGSAPGSLLAPPDLALDTAALEGAAAAGVAASLVSNAALDGGPLTPAEPVMSHGLVLIPVDSSLGEDLAAGNRVVDASRVLARTAMIFFESPGRRRLVALEIDWRAPLASEFLAMLRQAPWLEIVGPAAAGATRAPVATVRFAEVDPPPRSYLASLRRAESAVADFASYTLADNTLLAHYRLALASARATGGWADDWGRARAWSREVTASVGAQRRLIAVSSGSVTFTSQRGEVPVTVVNGAEYPVRVRIDVSSAKLRFPEGNDRVLDPLAPPGETVTFAALADATGTFPITVRLSSPDGRTVVATDELLVRSTAANVVGLALTAGGAAFLAVWYGRRIVTGRRRHGRDVEERRPGRGSRRRSFAGEQPHRREQDGEHRA